MINSRSFYKSFKGWVLPLFFILAGVAAFIYWAESQLSEPGGLREVEYWETVMASTHLAADVQPFLGYLHHRVAEMMVAEPQKEEALVTFLFMEHVLLQEEPLRKISDLKYALLAYKKQLFLAVSPALRLYISIRHYLGGDKLAVDLRQELLSESDARLEKLAHLQSIEAQRNASAIKGVYGEILQNPAFEDFQSLILLKLAYFLYESDPVDARIQIEKLLKMKPNFVVWNAATYLRHKLIQKVAPSRLHFKKAEMKIESLLERGLFEMAKQTLIQNKDSLSSQRMKEIQVWLGVKGSFSDIGKESLLTSYLGILGDKSKESGEVADLLMKLATDANASAYSALFRYQAWSLAYFDAKDFSRAFFISELLKLHDPLSLFGQLDAIKEMFRPALKKTKGAQLQKVWEEEPYRFDIVRKDVWEGFSNSGDRASRTMVHEGRVYVVNYDDTGKAHELQMVEAGEQVSTQVDGNEDAKEPSKMGWLDRYFYSFLMKFVPLGIRTFEEQIWKPAQKLKTPEFERFYSQDEFRAYVLDKIRPALGLSASSIHSEINEKGFHLYSIMNLKLINVPVSGQGKLLVSDDGRLNLKLDHVRVANLYMPKWLLKRVEKNFNLSANGEEQASIDILSMKYQAGGILIKCRRKIAT